jgi:hypothetical protein
MKKDCNMNSGNTVIRILATFATMTTRKRASGKEGTTEVPTQQTRCCHRYSNGLQNKGLSQCIIAMLL